MILTGLLFVCAVTAGILAFLQGRNMREYRKLQGRAAYISTQRARAQAVLNEALEYSKRNPAIDPLLQALGAKPRPATAPPMTPSTKAGK